MIGIKTPFEEFLENKYSIIKLKNHDNYCLIRAVMMAIYEKDDKNKFEYYKANEIDFEAEVHELAKKLAIENKPAGFNEYVKLENFFEDYQLMVFDEFYGNINDVI